MKPLLIITYDYCGDWRQIMFPLDRQLTKCIMQFLRRITENFKPAIRKKRPAFLNAGVLLIMTTRRRKNQKKNQKD